VHNAERPTEAFAKEFGNSKETQVVDVAPGFEINEGAIVRGSIRQRLSQDEVRQVYGDAIERVNRIAPVEAPTVYELKDMLEGNILKGKGYFGDYGSDFRCLLRIKGTSTGIRVVKTGRKLSVEMVEEAGENAKSYDVVYRTRASYLRQSLSTPYGHETLFVGSGGIFEFPDRSALGAGIHRELMTMLRPFDGDSVRRSVAKPGAIAAAKRGLKRLLGMSSADLYDLEKWTIFRRVD